MQNLPGKGVGPDIKRKMEEDVPRLEVLKVEVSRDPKDIQLFRYWYVSHVRIQEIPNSDLELMTVEAGNDIILVTGKNLEELAIEIAEMRLERLQCDGDQIRLITVQNAMLYVDSAVKQIIEEAHEDLEVVGHA